MHMNTDYDAEQDIAKLREVREAELLAVAHRALVYFDAVAHGYYISDHMDLSIGRELGRVLRLYDETP